MNSDSRKMRVELQQDADGYPPFDAETIWVRDDGSGRFVVDSIPFFAPELALGDTVLAGESPEGTLLFQSLAEEGGHSTIRVIMFRPSDVKVLRDQIQSLGCSSELFDSLGLVTVDIPPEVRYEPLRSFLLVRASDGQLEFQESCLAPEHRISDPVQ